MGALVGTRVSQSLHQAQATRWAFNLSKLGPRCGALVPEGSCCWVPLSLLKYQLDGTLT